MYQYTQQQTITSYKYQNGLFALFIYFFFLDFELFSVVFVVFVVFVSAAAVDASA